LLQAAARETDVPLAVLAVLNMSRFASRVSLAMHQFDTRSIIIGRCSADSLANRRGLQSCVVARTRERAAVRFVQDATSS